MILDMLKKENIQILDCVSDWKEAIKISLKSLEEQGYVTGLYAENIIKMTEEYGPYYVLTDNVALIHGRPEMGAVKKQIAVTTLKKPVYFSENGRPVQLMVALAATDSESHLDVMQTLAEIFMDKEAIQKIIDSEDEEQIFQYFLKAENQGEE